MSITRPEEQAQQQNQPQTGVLGPEHAGAEYVDPSERRLQELRQLTSETIRKTAAGKPVIVPVAYLLLGIAKHLAEESRQAGWVAEILPIPDLQDGHPLPSGSILRLTRAETSADEGEPRP